MNQSNEPTIEQMNEVIARFMGGKRILHPSQKHFSEDHFGYVCHNGRWWNENNLKYHTSWDWLMPVWSRLRLIVADHFDEDFPVEYCAMCDVWALHCEYVNINGAHKLLYDAITWFNQQPKTNGTIDEKR